MTESVKPKVEQLNDVGKPDGDPGTDPLFPANDSPKSGPAARMLGSVIWVVILFGAASACLAWELFKLDWFIDWLKS